MSDATLGSSRARALI